MPKKTIHRLLSALLVASFVPVAAAQVPHSLTERNAKILLPGVFGNADTEADNNADTDAKQGRDIAKAGEVGDSGGDTPETHAADDDSDSEASGIRPNVRTAEEPPLPGQRSPKRARKKSSKGHAKGSGKKSKTSGKKAAKKSPKTTASKKPKKRLKGAKECDFRTPIYEHEVAKGEHLGGIAGRYGVRRSDVIALNTSLKKNPDLLRPGQKLRICPELAPRTRRSVEHLVVKGENPTKIAKHYGLTVDELLRLQKGKLGKRLIANPRSLRIGDQLVVMIDVEEHLEFAPRQHHRGILRASTQLAIGSKFYLVKRPNLAYGTPRTIKAIKAAVSRYKQRRPKGPRVHIGDISKKGGGRLKPHKSHQKGVDVDVGLVHKGMLAGEKRFVVANAQTLDVGRTWALIKAFADTNEVRAIFLDYNVQKTLYDYARHKGVSDETLDELFQYPRGRGRAHGLVRHWRGHRNHFHVRFRG